MAGAREKAIKYDVNMKLFLEIILNVNFNLRLI